MSGVQIPIWAPVQLLGLLEDTPENRENLRQLLWIHRQYWEDRPGTSREHQEWVRNLHRSLRNR